MTGVTTKLLSMLSLGLLAASALAEPTNKWRIEFNGSSRSAGEIIFEVTPLGTEPIVVSIEIPDKTSENAVAKLVVKELKSQLSADLFNIERDDWEDVLIKKRRGAADFELKLVFSNVEHLRINTEHD